MKQEADTMARYAYIAGTTSDDINDESSIVCQLNYLKEADEHYDDVFIDTFSGGVSGAVSFSRAPYNC